MFFGKLYKCEMFQKLLFPAKSKSAQFGSKLVFCNLRVLPRAYTSERNKNAENKSIIEQKDLKSMMEQKDYRKMSIVEHEGEWQSKFSLFAPERGFTPDMIAFLQQDIDFWPSTIKKWWARKQEEKMIADQIFIPERVEILGCNLAAAHFLVYRGGAVHFIGHPDWVRQDKDGEYDLPSKYDKSYKVFAIDASGTGLRYEGLENLRTLHHLRILKLSNCPHIDDWCLDRISGEYRHTLEELDISGCPQITDRGLASLSRLKNLKVLYIDKLPTAKHLALLRLLLEDSLPNLKVNGVQMPTLETLRLEAGKTEEQKTNFEHMSLFSVEKERLIAST